MNKYDKILGEYREFDTSNLSDLGDVNKDGLTEGSVLKWNATTNKWEIGEQDASKWEGDGAGFVRPKSGGKVKAEHIDGISATVEKQITCIFKGIGLSLLDEETSCIVGYSGVIKGWKIYNEKQVSTVIQIEAYKNGTKISGTDPIKLQLQYVNDSTILTGWATAVTKSDIITFKVSASGINANTASIVAVIFVEAS